MTEDVEIETSAGGLLQGVFYRPEEISEDAESAGGDTLVIMIHDFPGNKGGHNDLYADLEHRLQKKSIASLRFDLRGCGESDGREEGFTLSSACEDIQQVLFWGKEQGFKNFIYLGEGLGASLALMNIAMDVRALILFWPVLDPKDYAENHISSHLKKHSSIRAAFEYNGHALGPAFLKELRTSDLGYAMRETFCPTLILHGAQDDKIPVSQLELARQQIQAKRIEITTFHDGGAGLPQLNHRKALFHHSMQFIQKYA